MRSYLDAGSFAGSVLVARASDVIISKGFGLANVEWNVPSTPDARFKVASITKQFTAAAILLLEERGRLKLDDRVKVYLPAAPPAWDAMTIVHLLTHTAGFPGLLPSREHLHAARHEGLWPRHGGSHVASRRVYTATPKGLVHASYASDRIKPNAAAGLYSTTADLLRWQNALYGGRVVSKSALGKMTTPFMSDYGLGVYVRTIDGRRAATHGGRPSASIISTSRRSAIRELDVFLREWHLCRRARQRQPFALARACRLSRLACARRSGAAAVGAESGKPGASGPGALRGRLPVRQWSDDDRDRRRIAARSATGRR